MTAPEIVNVCGWRRRCRGTGVKHHRQIVGYLVGGDDIRTGIAVKIGRDNARWVSFGWKVTGEPNPPAPSPRSTAMFDFAGAGESSCREIATARSSLPSLLKSASVKSDGKLPRLNCTGAPKPPARRLVRPRFFHSFPDQPSRDRRCRRHSDPPFGLNLSWLS